MKQVLAKGTQLKVLRALAELPHLFASSCLEQKMQGPELWQPFCNHEGKAKGPRDANLEP